MVIAYTEMASAVFRPAGDDAWEDYDIFTNLSVPKGAVAEILIGNNEVDTENEGGVRTDGSGLARLFDLQEAEDGGLSWVSVYVQVDSDTGLIEIYAEDTSEMEFRCIGYWTGCTFTEDFQSWVNVGNSVWEDKDLNALYGTPNESVVQIVSGNTLTAARRTAGVRTDGSALARIISLQEAEDGGLNHISWVVKTDADGEIETFSQQAGTITHYYVGYFSSAVDFTEAFTAYAPAGDAGWEDEDLTGDAIAPPASGIVYWALTHHSEAAENEIGVRDNGSGLDRKYDVRESEGTGGAHVVGFGITVNIDGNKICEVYSEVAAEAIFNYQGYFSDGVPPTTTTTTTAPPTTTTTTTAPPTTTTTTAPPTTTTTTTAPPTTTTTTTVPPTTTTTTTVPPTTTTTTTAPPTTTTTTTTVPPTTTTTTTAPPTTTTTTTTAPPTTTTTTTGTTTTTTTTTGTTTTAPPPPIVAPPPVIGGWFKPQFETFQTTCIYTIKIAGWTKQKVTFTSTVETHGNFSQKLREEVNYQINSASRWKESMELNGFIFSARYEYEAIWKKVDKLEEAVHFILNEMEKTK